MINQGPLHRGAFASFFSGEFTTMAVINPQEKKLAERDSVPCTEVGRTPLIDSQDLF